MLNYLGTRMPKKHGTNFATSSIGGTSYVADIAYIIFNRFLGKIERIVNKAKNLPKFINLVRLCNANIRPLVLEIEVIIHTLDKILNL